MIWEILLAIKHLLKNKQEPCEFLSVSISEDSFVIEPDHYREEASIIIDFGNHKFDIETYVSAQSPFKLDFRLEKDLDRRTDHLLRTYLPYAILPHFARKQQKCFAITHFAQTLDGRIASVNGDSKWIGNEENLIHAHKMRALCDGIMIGAKTLVNDNPRLNVRLVNGNNPTKVLIGGDDLDLGDYIAIDNNTIIFSQNHNDLMGDQRLISLAKKQNQYNPCELLGSLYDRGLQSVYIEGGSYTTSLFLKHQAIDQVQVHITPKIMGSGITGFHFEGLDTVKDAVNFDSYRFIPIGNQVMFVGEL